MNPTLRNVLAFIVSVVIGSVVNMGLIMISADVIPPPRGVDVTSAESLKASMHLFQPEHFLFPFLAHALGSLAGAYVVCLIAAKHHLKLALGISAFFLIGGIMNVFMLPAPLWFVAVDLLGAYLPMGWLGFKLAEKSRRTSVRAEARA